MSFSLLLGKINCFSTLVISMAPSICTGLFESHSIIGRHKLGRILGSIYRPWNVRKLSSAMVSVFKLINFLLFFFSESNDRNTKSQTNLKFSKFILFIQ